MATWNGSYPAEEESNYFVYSGRNAAPGTTVDTWPYFAGGAIGNTPAYLPNLPSGNYYPPASGGQHMYEQNASTSNAGFYTNVLPIPSNMVPLGNAYQKHILPNASPEDGAQAPNASSQHSAKGVRRNVSPSSHGNYSRRPKISNNYASKGDDSVVQSSIVVNSNLHPTASEFVPNDAKLKRERFNKRDSFNPGVQGHRAKSADVSATPDNRYKGEKRYDNKRSVNYKDAQAPSRSGYKDAYRTYSAKNYNKFQNDKYYNRRRQTSDASSVEQYVSGNPGATEFTGSSVADNLKTSVEGIPEDDFSGVNANEERALSHESNDSENASTKGEALRKPKRFGNYANTFGYHKYNNPDGPDRSELVGRITRRYTGNSRSERYESNYKGRKNHFNVPTGGRGNGYSKRSAGEKLLDDRDGNSEEATSHREKKVENWRDRTDGNGTVQKKTPQRKYEIDDDASQRERLTEQLNRGTLECLVCYEHIKQTDYVWSCANCYHVLHLKCIKKWAKSSQIDKGWRCPACQNVSSVVPVDYYCFCGKMKMPEWNRRDVAHSCGETCGRNLSKNGCVHKCTLLCHPGSCPQCVAMVTKYCGCGRTSQTLQCSAHKPLLCDSVCGKELPCGKHVCERQCHQGECGSCDKTVQQACFCGKKTQEVSCRANVPDAYSCDNICNKKLDCGKHNCRNICHPESCESCSLTPDRVTTCCCGQTPLTEKRESCLDPVPTCDKICTKRLICGQPSNPHTCKAACHAGGCPECDLSSDVKCRCGNMDREIACRDLTSKADDARCEKRCKKKRSCGKHNCNQLCCIDIEHICPLPCSKTLSCGRHKCEQRCHMGRCAPCWQSSFDELYCECGSEVIYPPVPCGTRRPACNRPCSRQHPCGHEVLHNCHSEPTCPPCSVLTQRWCHGKHELRKAVPCHVSEISCGLPCNKPLSCGRHKCITMCHSGPCEKPGQQCAQPCVITRELCGHICAVPCHDGKCPDTPCKEMVKVTCQCGHRTTSRTCVDNAREYQRIASNILASKMADMQLGHSVNLEEVFGQGAKKQNQLKTLECNDECKTIERNRRLALGLQIVNPDLSGKLMPRYSDYMKQWAKKDPHFCQMVHEKLTELVQLAKTSKHKSRSYSFDTMNREKRHFVHESCEHFGCESQAYDEEPKRNVVATAVKDKCWLPSYSLLEIVQRENGQRKVPGPVLNASRGNSSTKTVLSLPVKGQQSTSKIPDKEIDYFDYRG
ncbi:PREDICTED: protein shuttle craft [Dinoponera quadriceps]|uniref:Protein shuttle craft n=1 Tax=Dinoponera quadriceps TaxID=609295 RepID=A0A6P3X4I2_DINQU|nr:PREDICTED: protein shuttle craft [Dinoponera quadriceps]